MMMMMTKIAPLFLLLAAATADQCTTQVQQTGKWYAAIQVGFDGDTAVLDFSQAGLDITSNVKFEFQNFDAEYDGQKITLTKNSNSAWISSSSTAHVGIKPVSGKNNDMNSFSAPSCTAGAPAPVAATEQEITFNSVQVDTCSNSHGCDCFTCDNVENTGDGFLKVTIGHCKSGSISWMCCSALDGEVGNTDCDVQGATAGLKKESVPSSGLVIKIPDDSQMFEINTHDGKTAGDALNVKSVCGGPNGGQGGSCVDSAAGVTAHCLIEFDLELDCGYSPPVATTTTAAPPATTTTTTTAAPPITTGDCALPAGAKDYSVVSKSSAQIGAHSVYTGLAIGGTLKDSTPGQSGTVDGKSYISDTTGTISFNFNGGVDYGNQATTLVNSMWPQLEYLAEHAVTSTDGSYRVFVEESDGDFSMDSFYQDGQGSDNGKTLVIFKSCSDIRITKTSSGRQFGPTIIAPCAKVFVQDNTGYVDGSIYAKQVFANDGSLQLHGKAYSGPISCAATTAAPPATTAAPPTTTTSLPTTDEPMTTTSKPGTQGDPHFKTHSGEMYDFHGGCDLVLLDNPEFMNGLGMTVHIRTKIETWWSYVESAVLKIGEETVEIQQDQFHINGQPVEVTEKDVITKLSGLVFKYTKIGENVEAHILIGNGEKIRMNTYKGFVKVQIVKEGSKKFKGSHGLLGRYPDGQRVARDGETFIEDVNAFGQEWQVMPSEPKLFHSYDDAWVVPAGQKCAMPDSSPAKLQLRQRRLASGLETVAAEDACSHLEDAKDRQACVYDVIATQDLNMAGAW